MRTINKAIMSGLIAASAVTLVGASANAAFSPNNLVTHQSQVTRKSERLEKSRSVHKAVWSQKDWDSFWEQEEDRGG